MTLSPSVHGWQGIGFVLLPGFSLGALAGAVEVLHAANQLLETCVYEPLPLALQGQQATAAGGLPVLARPLAEAPPLAAAFVVADGAPPPPGDARHAPLLAWLVGQAAAGRVLGGIGSGAAWLAEAGLLRGRRATVHWPHIAPLAERHAEVVVSRQRFEIDRDRLSCAGQQASRDLLIAWLARRHGERFGPALAAQLGLARLRAADEAQRVPVAAQLQGAAGGGPAKLAEALALMEANLAEPLPTEEIARLVGVSRRQLERLFRQHLDALPSRWYLELRLQRARRLLRQTPQSVLQIALGCGFASGPHFSNAYRAQFGHTPRDERSQRALAWQHRVETEAVAPAGASDAPTGRADTAPSRAHDGPAP